MDTQLSNYLKDPTHEKPSDCLFRLLNGPGSGTYFRIQDLNGSDSGTTQVLTCRPRTQPVLMDTKKIPNFFPKPAQILSRAAAPLPHPQRWKHRCCTVVVVSQQWSASQLFYINDLNNL